MLLFPRKEYSGRIWRIALPAIAGLSSQMVVSIIDTAMVARLENSEVILAAMGIGVLATWTITSFFSSLATGTHILVARRYGEGKYAEAGKVLSDSLLISLLLGLSFGLAGYFYAYEFIGFFASSPDVARAGADYMKYRSLGIPFFLLGVSYRGFFYGLGHTKVFMFSAIVSYVFNIAFDYLLIFGAFGLFPKMGVAGAGLASSIGTALGLVFFILASLLKRYRRGFRYYNTRMLVTSYAGQIFKISLPVSFQNVLILVGFLVFVAITGIVGTLPQAATQVVITALFVSFMPCFGFGIAAQTLVGMSLGNKDPDSAYIYGVETARMATYFTVIIGAIFLLFPETVLGVISPSPIIIREARLLLQLAGVAQIAYGSGIVISSALQGAGDTMFVMYLEVVTHWVIFLPISYLLAVPFGLGSVGAWTAMPVYIVAYTAISWIKFRSGSWKKIRV